MKADTTDATPHLLLTKLSDSQRRERRLFPVVEFDGDEVLRSRENRRPATLLAIDKYSEELGRALPRGPAAAPERRTHPEEGHVRCEQSPAPKADSLTMLLLLSGPIAVGKSSVARELSNLLSGDIVSARTVLLRETEAVETRDSLQAAGRLIDQRTTGAGSSTP